MSVQEVNDYFEQYVYGFILADIEKEIVLAKSRLQVEGYNQTYSGGGNYLCALGLLCYTEFMGGIYLKTFKKSSHQLFNTFFYLMGENYKKFDEELEKRTSIINPKKKLSVYEVFRCGMAHEYFIKQSGVIYMLSGTVNLVSTMDGEKASLHAASSMLIGTVPYGIGILDDDRYFFVVEQYFIDFSNACRKIHIELMSRPNPIIPTS